ncbi:MAG: excinuclease ABC subunit UvrA, partial [Candidatus Ancillula sp.]|nr:excinuclease ABC subunit UvrA [Candidatus Ancillula sp.]
MSDKKLVVRGANVHNLRSVNVDIPRGAMAVFTGVSGSGKSSLAFDTIFAEGQRRYVESLSAYARMFLGQMEKPEVDFIEGLSPAVSIDQKSTNRNPRSTVGTITEVYDYLRLLFARLGTQFCPICDQKIVKQSVQEIVDQIQELPVKTKFQLLAPVVRGRKGEYADLFSSLRQDGFSRIVIDGEQHQLGDLDPNYKLSKQIKHNIEVVVDRLVIKDDIKDRLTDSVETALRIAEGRVIVDLVDVKQDTSDNPKYRKFSQNRSCPNEHELELDEIEPRTFSFNAPYGACPECTGIGFKMEIDPELIIPDPGLSIYQGAIAPWRSDSKWYNAILESLADELGFSLNDPWKEISKQNKKIILYGYDDDVSITYRNRWGRIRQYSTKFEGVINMLLRRYRETESELAKNKYEEYMRETPCRKCKGKRLKPEVLAVKIKDKNITDITDMSIQKAYDFVKDLEFKKSVVKISDPILKEIRARLKFLLDVGLNYLTLSRSAATLSGGEAQRIRLATQIGSGLAGVLYVLDEPSIGLHQRDNSRLIEALQNLKNLDNTLIVVEHDEETIQAADWIVDVGPMAGEYGGDIVFCGPSKDFSKATNSLTSDYVYGRKQIEIPKTRRHFAAKRQLTVVGAKENNLKNITVKFPLEVFCCITGVSGSGKSSLVNSILFQVLQNKLNRSKNV